MLYVAVIISFIPLLPSTETMLKLVEFCRKYETEQEKVLPFFSPSQEPGAGDELPEFPEELMDPGRAAAAAVARAAAEEAEALAGPSDPNKPKLSSHGVDDNGKEVEEWDYLNRFFKRFNKALLDKTAIDKEKSRLEKENADLRSILKQYLDGISVNDEVMNNPINPLMVVNNRLQVTLAERNKARAQVLTQRGGGGSPAATGQQPQPQLALAGVGAGAQKS